MFGFGRKCTASSTMSTLLDGIVETSMAAVNIGVQTGSIQKSAGHVNDLVGSTGAASEEMSSTVKGIADHANQAAAAAKRAGDNTRAVARTMQQVTTDMQRTAVSMDSLQNLSSQIQNIIGTISDISDQTNLLALNAAIEAARAGDAGRGFAVVADEVRKLSGQTQKSANEITDMVKRIQTDIQNAADAVKASQSSLVQSVEGVKKLEEGAAEIDNLMGSIAHSTKEQSEASSQIAQSILEVSDVAQTNVTQTSQILTMLDNLTSAVESQRALLAEQDIPHKVLSLAQADHALWKKKLVDFSLGRIHLEPKDVGDHNLCRLGKWYYSAGKQHFGSQADFMALEEPHRRVHAAARAAVEARSRDKHADLSSYIAEVEQASELVIQGLKKLLARQRG
ncbi:MAG: methyl-accepting chemotaxis protein [Alphaproteobacteria bacterium]